MISRLYECNIQHARLHPRRHRFAYRIFLLALDLDELPDLGQRLRLLGIDRPGLLSFRQNDYLPTHDPLHNPSASRTSSAISAPSTTTKAEPTRSTASAPPPPLAPLKTRVLAHLAAQGIDPGPGASVLLLTLPRVFGYLFNPVSFYFVSDAAGRPVASIAEVTNTFRETKPFVLGPSTLRMPAPLSALPATAANPSPLANEPVFHLRVPKHFYVSPFSDVDLAFDFRLRPPGQSLALQIDDFEGERLVLVSTVTGLGPPRPLNDRVLAWFSLKYPLVTLKVIAAIHWEAFRLWAKRVPWFAKSARAADQRDLHHPHASLSRR
jgi:DUF1365 family protein